MGGSEAEPNAGCPTTTYITAGHVGVERLSHTDRYTAGPLWRELHIAIVLTLCTRRQGRVHVGR